MLGTIFASETKNMENLSSFILAHIFSNRKAFLLQNTGLRIMPKSLETLVVNLHTEYFNALYILRFEIMDYHI